jgi:hypothetical protein
MTDTSDYEQWRIALGGGKPDYFLNQPWCGYFATQDRSSTVKAARWPLIACAIWRDASGALVAERGGSPADPMALWQYCAKRPITYERYKFWHTNHKWPEEAEAA